MFSGVSTRYLTRQAMENIRVRVGFGLVRWVIRDWEETERMELWMEEMLEEMEWEDFFI